MSHKAVFHKGCIAKYNKSKLETKISRKRKLEEENVNQNSEVENNENREETKRQPTRQSMSLYNFSPVCFFCEKDSSEAKLHQCQTFQVHQKVLEIAHETADTKVLAKLSEGDMIAIEAKYHCKCLVAYYKNIKSETLSTDVNTENGIICGNIIHPCFIHISLAKHLLTVIRFVLDILEV